MLLNLPGISALVSNRPLLRALQGAIASVGAPLGWLLIQYLQEIPVLQGKVNETTLYLYMLFGTIAVFSGFGYYVGRQEAQANNLALIDPLTGLANVRAFHAEFDNLMALFEREQKPLFLAVLDLDHFKKVNDTYGHDCGDVVLREVTTTMKKLIRPYDVLARVGGEEFALLLSTACPEEACNIVRRIRQTIADTPVRLNKETEITITVSIGLTQVIDKDSKADLYNRADLAMYQAKQNGRNNVQLLLAD